MCPSGSQGHLQQGPCQEAGGSTQVTLEAGWPAVRLSETTFPRPRPLSLAFPVGGEARTGASSTRVGSSMPPPPSSTETLTGRQGRWWLCLTDSSHPSFKSGASLCSASRRVEPECAFPKMASCLASCPHSGHTVPPRLGLSYYNGLQQRKSHHFSLR